MCNHLIDRVNMSSELACNFGVYFALCDDCEMLLDSKMFFENISESISKQACKLYEIYQM